MNIGIYIYEEAEVLDFSGPFEVFSTASRFLEEDKKFNVFLIAEKSESVLARGGYDVNAKYNINNHPQLDLLIVAGGVHTQEMKKDKVITWIKNVSTNTKIVASVCTGAFLLAQAKVVTTHKVTTHWEDIADLKESFPTLDVKSNVRWVDEDSIVTSGGISAGIDMSLHIVSRIHSLDLAEKTARQMEFTWTKN
ncbi:glutamine amidotransferase [Arcobacter sp. 31_11_sub10_T18]|nr:glutamine amidotransferase [Arcobacter sp. 31_11_sub10_T18]